MNSTAFLTSIITWYAIIPSALLCFAAMRNQMRLSRRRAAVIILVTLTISSLAVATLKACFIIPRNALIPLIIIPAFIAYTVCVSAPVYKSLSICVLVFAFMSFLVNISNGFDAALHPHGVLNDFSLQAAVFQAVITTVFALLALYPASHQVVKIIDSIDLPRVYYATVPVWGMFLAFNLLISPRKYETLHVNLMQIAYWGSLALLFILLCLLCVLFYYIVTDMMDKADLEERNRIFEMQESAYQAQMRYINDTSRTRHDFKHVIATLDELSRKGDMEAMRRYIEEYRSLQPKKEIESFCLNAPVNALLNYYAHLARELSVKTDWEIALPEDTGISDVDLCSVIGNILENAVLACKSIPVSDRFIDLRLLTKNDSGLYIVCTNSFDGTSRMRDGRYLSTRSSGNGLGLKSIASTAAKYDGTARFYHEGTSFYTDVMLPFGASRKE
ncbi:MAG: sensor histidine kinase [Lachnospiraceae bacterium]|nr:sensor histidine kinase [Lachnospiraceae bacterium]